VVLEMTIPNAIYAECPFCQERTLHEVLKGRLGKKRTTMESTVRCLECGQTHSAVIREGRPVQLAVIVSDQGQSRKEMIEASPDEVFAVDEEFFVNDTYVVVTSIEREGRRVNQAPADGIDTIWVKRYDKIKLKVSLNKGHKTVPSEFFALPDEEFFVGDIIPAGRSQAVIHQMKTNRGMVREGGVEAREIVRIYAKAMRVTTV
jgi:uncharacterized Zn finger protein